MERWEWLVYFIFYLLVTGIIVTLVVDELRLRVPSDVLFQKEGGFTDEEIEVIKSVPGVIDVSRTLMRPEIDRSIDRGPGPNQVLVRVRTGRIRGVQAEIKKMGGRIAIHGLPGGWDDVQEYLHFSLLSSIIIAFPIASGLALLLVALHMLLLKKLENRRIKHL